MSAEITQEVELELDIYELVQLAHRVRRQIHRTSMEQRQELEGIGGLLMSLAATDALACCPNPQTNTKETAA